MGEVVVGSGEIDCWREVVPVQHEDRGDVNVSSVVHFYQEYHVKLTSEEDDCFLYRTVITPEEHRRLMLSHSMSISFDQLPEYFRQLLKSVRYEGEFGERYFINVLAQNTPGLAARIEMLITMRQAGYVVQNKRLCLPFTLASDADFKEHLIGCFDKIKKEKEQLRRSVALLETQLREERLRSRELEDKNRWLQKELEFSQGLLKSAENIQKHYESLLNQKHRGEIGGSVLVKIDDSVISGDATATGSATNTFTRHASDPTPLSVRAISPDADAPMEQSALEEPNAVQADDEEEQPAAKRSRIEETTDALSSPGTGSNRISDNRNSADNDNRERISPSLDIAVSTTASGSAPQIVVSTTSPCDKKTLKGAAKRKASFHNYTANQNGNGAGSSVVTVTSTANVTTTTSTSQAGGSEAEAKATEQPQRRPPPRKYAAAMVQVDSQLIQIRREQEQQQRKTEDEEEADEAKAAPSSPSSSTVDTSTVITSVSSQPVATTAPQETQPVVPNDTTAGKNGRTAITSAAPPRPYSQPTVLVSPGSSHQQALFAAPPPPMPTAPTVMPSAPVQLPPHFQPPWHIMSNAPSLPMVSSLHIGAAAAAAFGGHHDFVGLGMSPYLLPAINSVSSSVVTSMVSSVASSSAALDPLPGGYEDYNAAAENFVRNVTEPTDILNERLREEMSGDSWSMVPKSEPGDYPDDHLNDSCSRDSIAVTAGCRNGTNPSAGLVMGHGQLMSAVTMNENSMSGTRESPAQNGVIHSNYSASASPSLSTSSADGVDGVISYLKCLICERSFGQEGAAAHMAQHITDPQRCVICTEMPPFPSKDELIKHMVGHCARAYACRYCGKENPRVHYLKIHVRSHTGEKPYTCLQCGRGFADASTWRRHERVHTGEKPYECTICGRRIARRDNVKIHMRSHMRSKVQMSCRTCGKVFAQPNHLVLHERMCGGVGGVTLKSGSVTSTSGADLPIVD